MKLYNSDREDKQRVCCNCRHNIRTRDNEGHCTCNCEIDGHFIPYLANFEVWCHHWAKDKEWYNEEKTGNWCINSFGDLVCSNCGNTIDLPADKKIPKYCSKCGLRMKRNFKCR